jgi:hypothetical protein
MLSVYALQLSKNKTICLSANKNLSPVQTSDHLQCCARVTFLTQLRMRPARHLFGETVVCLHFQTGYGKLDNWLLTFKVVYERSSMARVIAEVKQLWFVIGWVTKNLELLRASEGTLSCWSRHLQSLAPTNPHWARVVGCGPLSLCAIHKEDLCLGSGDIHRLMMMMM